MKKRCLRCSGRGVMYRVGSAYCVTNMGGKEVKCPLCLGERFIDVDEILNKTNMDSRDVKKRRRKAKISEVRESEES